LEGFVENLWGVGRSGGWRGVGQSGRSSATEVG
jgi:hypothetical protein